MRSVHLMGLRAVGVALIVALGAGPVLGGPADGGGADGAVLQLKVGRIDVDATSSLHRAVGLQHQAIAGGGRYIVQLDGPLTAERTAQLDAAGVRLGSYIPSHAYIVKLGAGFDPAARLGALPFVRWVGPFQNGWKLDPDIGRESLKSAARRAIADRGDVDLWVSLFEGEAVDAAVARISAIAGVQVQGTQLSGDVTRVHVVAPRTQYAKLAEVATVQWVEEVGEVEARNYNGNWISQSDVQDMFPVWAHGLTGVGQVGGLIDGNYFGTEGLNADHCSFRDPGGNPIGPTHRKLVAYFGTNNYDLHATHCSGTMVGNEEPISGLSNHRGAAYGAKLAFTNIRQLNPSFDNLSLCAMLTQDAGAGATVHSNSWGGGGNNYNIWCQDIDKFSYNNEDDLVVFAVNNFGSVTKPENAKNLLAVAATNDAPNQQSQCYGGTGPTADGRRRPEIMAPGCGVISSASGGATCDFVSDGGTSMACPMVAGCALLARQYFTEGFYPSGAANPPDAFTPSGALMKAVLLNSTLDMTGVAGYPSDLEGWGRLRLDDALYFSGENRKLIVFDDRRNANGLTTGQTLSYDGNVLTAGEPLRITLVWTEKEAALNANPVYINDVDLEVTVGGATLYRGNVFAGGQSATGGSSDTKNNTEQVLIVSPPGGPFNVTVRATAVNTPGPQGFAVVATGDIGLPVTCMPADMNGDGFVNGDDIQAFVRVLITGTGTPAELCAADVNQDAGRDGFDVAAFVQCETAAGPCPP